MKTKLLRTTAVASLTAVTLAPSALADGQVASQFTPGGTAEESQAITVFTAKQIITMERANPRAAAVAVKGRRIVTAGSLNEVKAALGDLPFQLDETFAGKVVMPGFIEQHLHPILALTLAM